jgi:TatD DNase family protein
MIDSHCHLHDPAFDADRDAALARMRAAGVAAAVVVGTSVDDSRRAVELARAHPDLFAAVSVHPNSAAEAVSDADWAALEALARDPRVVAVGETGLDYYRDHAPPDRQRALFSRLIALARAVGKPVIIHCRDAYADCLAQLRAEWPAPVRGVMHCFSGTAEDAKAALDLGMRVSIAGPVTFPKAHGLREIARLVPADRLLLETDAPYLAPQPWRGKRNEPAYVAETVKAVALARGEPVETVAAATAQNARELFRIPA